MGYHSKSCLVISDCYFIRLAVIREGENGRFKSGTEFLQGKMVKKKSFEKRKTRNATVLITLMSSPPKYKLIARRQVSVSLQ